MEKAEDIGYTLKRKVIVSRKVVLEIISGTSFVYSLNTAVHLLCGSE